jgi:hypothetical protein
MTESLFREVTTALGSALDYIADQYDLDLQSGFHTEDCDGEPEILSTAGLVYERAIEIVRPDLCPTCGFYKTIHPTEDCERQFMAEPQMQQSYARGGRLG